MGQEIEAKFYVEFPMELLKRLQLQGAVLTEPRAHELNLRFDTPGRDLRRAGRVLRLRQDTKARITYKDADQARDGSLSRREVEFEVSDFGVAREFLEALGYEVAFIYEKYRTTYRLNELEIMSDEMPYGHFVEIEGSKGDLRTMAEGLGLNWKASIPASYSQLFETLRNRRGLTFRDLTFENLQGIEVAPSDLGVESADWGPERPA
jgi:adenylate cyclase, class 2